MNSRRRQYPIVLVEKVVAYAQRPEVTTRQLKEYAAELFGFPVPQSTIANWLSRNGVRLLDANRTPAVEQNTFEARLFMRSPAAIRERNDTNGQEKKVLLIVYNIFANSEAVSAEKVLEIVHRDYPNLSNRQLENIFQKYMLTCKITDYERNQIPYEQLTQEVTAYFPELLTPMSQFSPRTKVPSSAKHNSDYSLPDLLPVTNPSLQHESREAQRHQMGSHISDPRVYHQQSQSFYLPQQIPVALSAGTVNMQPHHPIIHSPPKTSPIIQTATHQQSPVPSPPHSQYPYPQNMPMPTPMSQAPYHQQAFPLPNQQYSPINALPPQTQQQQASQYSYPMYYSSYVTPNNRVMDSGFVRPNNQNVRVPPQA